MLIEIAVALFIIALFIYLRPTPSAAKSKALRHLPNPPSPKHRLPFIGHLHLLDNPLLHHSLIRLGERYGPLYSLYFGSVPTIVASTPDLFKLFLQTHEVTSFNTRFQTSAIKRLTYDNSVAMVPFGPYWKFIRKLIMNDLLNASTINKLRPLRSKEILKFLNVMAKSAETQQPLNITEELLKWTNSTISTMMLGEVEEVRDIARDVVKIFGEYNVTDFIWPLKFFKKFGNYEKRIDDIFNKYDPIIEKVIKKRQEIVNKRRSGEIHEGEVESSVVFLDTLLEFAQDETMEIKITKEQIKGLVVDFFSAGTDSTAVATEWTLAELINNPRVLKKAQEEIESVVGKDRLVDESDVQNLPYIRAIVKEAFRLHPPLPLVTRKCTEECEINGYVIPKGALILLNVWQVGRDPKYWEKPLEFRPERFLENAGEGEAAAVDLRGQYFTLLPFGSGRRVCPGVNLAIAGMATLLASIIHCFDLQVPGPHGQILKGGDAKVSMDERHGLAVPRAHNLVCVPVARGGVASQILSS